MKRTLTLIAAALALAASLHFWSSRHNPAIRCESPQAAQLRAFFLGSVRAVVRRPMVEVLREHEVGEVIDGWLVAEPASECTDCAAVESGCVG